MEANNMKAMREALETLLNLAYEVQDANSECGAKTSVPAQFLIDVAKSALSAPPRNCDRLQGDGKKLNAEWFDWTGSPSGQNPDGTVKMAFGEWLLAMTAKKGGEA